MLEAGNPDSNLITWKKNSGVQSVLRGYTSSLNASEYGTYTCTALNMFGTSEAQIHLAQKGKKTVVVHKWTCCLFYDFCCTVVLQMQFFLPYSERCIEPQVKDMPKARLQLIWNLSSMQVSYTIVEETLLQQLIATLALVCNCTITSQNLQNTSLMCSEKSKSLIFTAEFVYSNPEGSLTASSLVNLTREWIKGIRTVNGSNLQLDTDCPIQLPKEDVMPPSGCEATDNMEVSQLGRSTAYQVDMIGSGKGWSDRPTAYQVDMIGSGKGWSDRPTAYQVDMIGSGKGQSGRPTAYQVDMIGSGKGWSDRPTAYRVDMIGSGKGWSDRPTAYQVDMIGSGKGWSDRPTAYQVDMIGSGKGWSDRPTAYQVDMIGSGKGWSDRPTAYQVDMIGSGKGWSDRPTAYQVDMIGSGKGWSDRPTAYQVDMIGSGKGWSDRPTAYQVDMIGSGKGWSDPTINTIV